MILKPLTIIILLTLLPLSKSNLDLKKGHSISVTNESDFITSPDSTFTCGFYSLGTNASWLAIWFTNSVNKTVVWTANRNSPVNGKGSKATIRSDGTMVVTDVDGTVVWQTHTTNTNVDSAQLLNSGNLVLKTQKGDILWQSFGFPTDTLLPLQMFTKSTRLTSVLRKGSSESGIFYLYFDSYNVLRLISDSVDASTTYWPNPDFDIYSNGRTIYNSTRLAVLDDSGRFVSSDGLQFSASDMGFGIKRRLTLDYDGNLRLYSLNETTGFWSVTWQALGQPCSVKGICGRNAVCVYVPEPTCMCVDPRNWNKGCEPVFSESLLLSRKVKFLEVPHTDFYGFDLNVTYPVTLGDCEKMCLEDFRCKGFSYRLLGQGYCFGKSALLNGFTALELPASVYIKLPKDLKVSKPDVLHASGEICASNEEEMLVGSPSMRWVYVYSFAGALGGVEMMFIVIGWWFLFRIHGIPSSVEAGYNMILSQFRRYSYSELKKATGNFKLELGRGGSGSVYKGVLSNDRVVAIKRLGDAFQAEEEFFAEISVLGKINHMNLVRIWGFCSERRHRLLVYEYLDKLSLDKHVFGSDFLDWRQRYAVALGTAKGLAYLHHECLEWVIHCDVKPENILLDSDFEPKIADFGLAKLLQREDKGKEFTRIRGTKGYMAPEWALNLPITAKVDVFAYGVVVLELVRGMRLCNWIKDDDRDDQETGLMNFVRKSKEGMKSGSLVWVESVVDSRLEGRFSRNQAVRLIQTGISCVQEDRNKRPTMASVVQTLLEFEHQIEVKGINIGCIVEFSRNMGKIVIPFLVWDLKENNFIGCLCKDSVSMLFGVLLSFDILGAYHVRKLRVICLYTN